MKIFRCCCSFKRPRRREEVYYYRTEDKTAYSWDETRLDPADFQYVNRFGEVLAKLNGHVKGQQFTIDKCKECCMLILDYTAAITIDDCENCLIVTGPCKGSVYIRNCKNCTLFTACTQFRARDCSNMDIFLFCITKPSIEESKSIRFRPLSLHYDGIEDHAFKAFRNLFINNWNSVYDFTPSSGSDLSYKICDLSYKTIERMDLVNNLEKVKFDPESSFFPVFSHIGDGDQVFLLLCIQAQNDDDESFARKTLRLTRSLQSKEAKIFSLKQYQNKKSVSLPTVLMCLVDAASFVVIEATGEQSKLEESVRPESSFCVLLCGGAVRLTKKYLHNLEP